ncbi:MAG: sulfatase-like hydrolase/transferase [Acidobacteriaceae bacterium]|nr:sulfatase-like hydrolase/transferase [Acidobacteriaceae bacterium]
MKRREFLKTSAGVVAASISASPLLAATKPHERLNLLFITVDDMNWSLPGFMGNALGLTPNLDKLAAGSYRFVHTRTTAAICQPSREAMMTGRVPHRSGALGFTPVNEGTPTLVTALKQAGYFAAAIHKTEHMQPPSCFPWDKAVVGQGRAPSEYGAAVTDAIAAAREVKKPFFLNCNINDPHRPFYGSEEAAEVDHQEQGEYRVAREVSAADVTVPAHLDPLANVKTEYAQYCNSAQRMDISIGKVLAALAATPEAANTIVFFSADHGMPFPFSKATVYDSGTRTPALLKLPKMRESKTFSERTSNVDYMPTLLDLLQVPHPEGMDGHSWAPLLHGRKYAGSEFTVTHINSVAFGANYPMRAIQDDRYSLVFMAWSDRKLEFHIESMKGLTWAAMKAASQTDAALHARVDQFFYGIPLAFYDLQEDPGQRTNIVNAPQHAARVSHMKEALLNYMMATGDPQLENYRNFLAGNPMHVEQGKPLPGKPNNY